MASLTTRSLRQRWRRSSLRWRVVFAIVAVAIAPQLLIFAWTQVDRKLSGNMWGATREAAKSAADVQMNTTSSETKHAALLALAQSEKVTIRVLGADGQTELEAAYDEPLSAFDRLEAFFLGGPTLPSRAELAERLGPPGDRNTVRDAIAHGPNEECEFYEGLLVCQAAIHLPRTDTYRDGPTTLMTEGHTRRAVQMVYALRHQVLRLALITVPLACLLAFYMGRRVSRPLDQLRDEALAQSSRATRNVALSTKHADEVGDLAVAINELLAALETKRSENEAFIADLVHELKTPIAAMRAAGESVTTDLTAERAQRIARVMGDSTGKMDRLVTQFLELARAEAEVSDEARTEIDLAALVSGLVTSAKDDERHQGVAFDLIVPSGGTKVVVRGIDHRLEGAIRELIENAASFEGARHVGVQLDIVNDTAVVVVTDDGPGIAAEHLPKVFDRFFTTRARQRGTGLGLALVKTVVEAHGGSVSAANVASPAAGASDAHGAQITVRLPLAARSS